MKRAKKQYYVYCCSSCGLGITWPFPGRKELETLYSSENYRFHDRRFIFPLEQISRYLRERRLSLISKLSQKGRVLDIGCGRGIMLSSAKKAGWEVYGLEFNADTAFYAKEVVGHDIRTGNINDADFEPGTFDVITIIHVLEHLENPYEAIEACGRLLKPGGSIVISVPNLDSIQSILSGRHWFHLDVPCHLYHFSEENLKKLLVANGFNVFKVRHFSFGQSLFGIIQSFLNLVGIRNNFLYDTLKSGHLRKVTSFLDNFKNIFLTSLLMPPVLILSLLLSLIEVVLKKGGEITVYAKKN